MEDKKRIICGPSYSQHPSMNSALSKPGYRSQEIINLNCSDEESITAASASAPAMKPSATLNSQEVPAKTMARRRFSIDSLSDSSSGSLEELLQRASISERLLAKPPAIVHLDGFELNESSLPSLPKTSSLTSGINPPADPSPPLGGSEKSSTNDILTKSAWLVDEVTGDFVLSKEKCSDKDWPNLALPASLYQGLYEFQQQAVQWMAGLHCDHSGGALCDDMGMGKTVTTLSLIGGLMRAGSIQTALVIAPLSVLQSWETTARKILGQCLPSVKVTVLNSDISQYRRQDIIQSLKTKDRHGRFTTYDLVITTYGLVRSATPDFMSHSIRIWDYVVLDEGHQIKNHTSATSQACRKICSADTHRLLLTGTPIMNNLKELWSVFDFATQGKLLGTLKTFNQYYARHIEAARDRLATEGVIVLGQRKNEELQGLIRPYFLQRLKKDHLKDKLPQKHDIVVWTDLSYKQRQLYLKFVNSKDSIVRSILTGAVTSPLEAITWLKKLCGHPLLIEATGTSMGSLLSGANTTTILEQSAKLQVLLELVISLRERGHRMLIFSQSTKMLDTIAAVLNSRFQLSRIDGSTPGRDRQRLVDEFNMDDSRCDAMLLSTKAAGCGLTLIGADTSIIYDPSWTPSEDAQAVDRCYRIGQTKEVTVYRLIAAGTVEERMYEKQVYKDGIRHAVLSKSQDVARHFERHELSALFNLGEPGVCRVMEKFSGMAKFDRYEFVYNLTGVIGITPHDGFYADADQDSARKTAFDGSATAVAPKVLGRAQRVMAKETNTIDLKNRTSRNAVHKKSTVTDETTTKDENNSLNAGKGVDNEAVERMMATASLHLEQQRPRKALEILLDTVETTALEGTQKLEIHRRIADVAQALDLL